VTAAAFYDLNPSTCLTCEALPGV